MAVVLGAAGVYLRTIPNHINLYSYSYSYLVFMYVVQAQHLPMKANHHTCQHAHTMHSLKSSPSGHAGTLFSVYILRWNKAAMWEGGVFGLTTTW